MDATRHMASRPAVVGLNNFVQTDLVRWLASVATDRWQG